MRSLMFGILGILQLCAWNLWADKPLSAHPDAKKFIQYMVKTYHFKSADLTKILDQAVFQPKIIASMERPYEKKTWDVYKQLFLTPERVKQGLLFWQENQESLAKAQKKYKVPAQMIVAIIGIETLYGKHQGTYRVLDALTTLAFHYPKRAAFFTKELKEYLLLCREHNVPPTMYLGSYAGAMGKPQFMPSSYRFYAASFDKKNKKDLMHNNQDVIASVANYFHQHGWQLNQHIAQQACLLKQTASINTHYKKAHYRYQALTAAGVKPLKVLSNPPQKAGLITLTTHDGLEHWLAYPNFYVITRYNTSPQYALSVYLLAQQLQHQRLLSLKKETHLPHEPKLS
ncbi:MAG: lytic murein transglycosylase B [Legionellaceae bacterium]|nr:lytic murein transglycosylase B [Legionellaceae bacterium]HAF87532.1 lytic murein transglycosylase B [Legionellales bacterium]HCA89807.1 lytic murein transglycosylase B [Legionellales bacterium]